MLDKQYYREYVVLYNNVWQWLLNKTKRDTVSEIMQLRNYTEDSIFQMLKKIGFAYIDDLTNTSVFLRSELKDLGLTKNDRFILQNRYIFPVRDMLGNVLALIGWYPDEKKYITTPGKLYSTNGMFFGMEQLKDYPNIKETIITEGIFDSISVRSCGYTSIAQMGIRTSEVKTTLYSLFGKRLLAIPDNDESGKGVVKADKWRLPKGSSYLTWVVSGDKKLKDIDDLYKYYGKEYLSELLRDALDDYERVITYKIL